jgi:hypothetical protein
LFLLVEHAGQFAGRHCVPPPNRTSTMTSTL